MLGISQRQYGITREKNIKTAIYLATAARCSFTTEVLLILQPYLTFLT